MPFILSSSELEILTGMYKKEKNKVRANRINIILLLHKGYTGLEISSILNIEQDTVSKWKQRYQNRASDENWLDDHYKPYTGKLSCHQISLLRTYIRIFRAGNKKEIKSFLEKTFLVSYTLSGVNKLLHRTGHSYQIIHKLPGNMPHRPTRCMD